jgi:hypothetical protein
MPGITERDLVRKVDEAKGIVFYQAQLPDGRFLQVNKEGKNKFTMSRSGMLSARVVMRWAWVVADPTTNQVMSSNPAFETRRAAFQNAMTWADSHEAGILRPPTHDEYGKPIPAMAGNQAP